MNSDDATLIVLALVFVAGVVSGGAIAFAIARVRTRAIARKLDRETSSEAAEASGAIYTPRLRVRVTHPRFEGRTTSDLFRSTFPELAALGEVIAVTGRAPPLPELVILEQSHELVIEVQTGELQCATIVIARPRAEISPERLVLMRAANARLAADLIADEEARKQSDARDRIDGEKIAGMLSRPDCDELVRGAFEAGELGAREPATDPPPRRRISRTMVAIAALAMMHVWWWDQQRRENDRLY